MVARAFGPSLLAGALTLGLGAGCGSGPVAPHGSPVLIAVYWATGDATALVYANPPSTSVASAAPPLVDEIDFVFDRRLDGARIEDTFDDGGVVVTAPMAMPPITASWVDAKTKATKDLPLAVQYNSVPRFGGDSSYVFARPAAPGAPADTTIDFALAASRLTSAYGEPADAPAQVPVTTSALVLAVSAPTGTTSGAYQVPLAFSNRMDAPPATSPLVHVRDATGADVPYQLLADPTLVSRWYVAPAACLGRWPSGATLTVVVDAGLADAFGSSLAAGATTTFTVGAGTVTSTCAPPDGGTGDASGAGDPSDAGAPDAPDDATAPS